MTDPESNRIHEIFLQEGFEAMEEELRKGLESGKFNELFVKNAFKRCEEEIDGRYAARNKKNRRN